MTCSQAQELMYLYRPGELTGRRRLDLEKHLASCPACSAERRAALAVEKSVSEARSREPLLEDPAQLTGAIMEAIAAYRPWAGGVLRSLPVWVVAPAFRVAACVVLILLCGSFFLQTALDANEVAALEGRLGSESISGRSAGHIDLRRLIEPQREGARTFADRLIIGEPDLRSLQSEAGISGALQSLLGRPRGAGTTVFFDYLAKKHPRLASIRIDDGLDDREREIIASDGEAFLKDVELLMREGGIHHDR